jgi:aldose 1-epimerase
MRGSFGIGGRQRQAERIPHFTVWPSGFEGRRPVVPGAVAATLACDLRRPRPPSKPPDMNLSANAVELQRGQWRLHISPQLGGSVLGLWCGATPVLRPAPEGASRAGDTAGYPLLPHSNRIGQGRMHWRGQSFTLRNGFDGGPHPLHGVGFLHAWQVLEHGDAWLRLGYAHVPDDHWPFAFEAEQRFDLLDDGLSLTISVRNTDAREQPMGLGWHPYFVRRPDSALALDVDTQWLCGPDLLPTGPVAVDGLRGRVADLRLDHCFAAPAPVAASLRDSALAVTLEADSRYWVVYTPVGADFYCVEPVTHVNNAVQMDDPLQHGLVALAPGGVLQQRVRCRVTLP